MLGASHLNASVPRGIQGARFNSVHTTPSTANRALELFEGADRLAPKENSDPILPWNRRVRELPRIRCSAAKKSAP